MTTRLLLLDDSDDHEVLLRLIAADAGVELVARVASLDDLPAAVAVHDPEVVVVDVWLGREAIVGRLDEVIRATDGRGLVFWTHDPWTAQDHLQGRDVPLVERMAPQEELLRALERR